MHLCAIRAVCYTDDVQEFPEMSQHQQFLVPLRTFESTEKGPLAQSVHGDKPVTMFSGQVQGQVNTQNTKYKIWGLASQH